jgi:SanA protein
MRRKRVLRAAALGALALVLASNGWVLSGGRQATVESPDCALVLGAGVHPDGSPSMVLGDRLEEALSLYRSGRVRRILVSGDHRTVVHDEPNAMRTWLEAHGVPEEDIFMDHAGLDTYSSMWRAKHVFGASRVVIPTQQFHLPRALWLARSLGMEAEGAPADRRTYRGAVWFQLRELLSRPKAFAEVSIHRSPRHAGPPISLKGDGRVTR